MRLPGLHPGQAKIEQELARYNVLACGRRFGKDVYLMNKTVEAAADKRPVAWAAPTYKMLTENWRAINDLVAPIILRRDSQEKRLELVTGGVIDFWSLDAADAIRGRKYKRFIINEGGYCPNLYETWSAIIRPTLVDVKGDLFVGGTPKGMNGFWMLFQNGASEPDWRSWQMSSYENPHISKDEIDAMVAMLPERVVQQEVYANFLDDAGGVFRRVMDAATAQEQDEPIPGHEYLFGVDWGRSNDYTVITVLDITDMAVVYIDRFSQVDYNLQSTRLRALYDRFRPHTIIAEYNSMGGPMVERLQSEGLPVQAFTTTNATKAQAIDNLTLAFERGDIRILNDPVLISELQAYEATRLPSGLMRYGAPEGMHDDCVMSLALAWAGTVAVSWLVS